MPDNKIEKREVKYCPWIITNINSFGFIDKTPFIKSTSTRFGECLYDKCQKYKNGECIR